MSEIFTGPDGAPRCQWCGGAPEFLDYHDQEWGFPVGGDIQLFEKLCLESFQSGLSWRTILSKRENFRAAFHHFNFRKVARFSEKDIENLLQNAGIVRHQGKIRATVNNAKCALELVEEAGSLAVFFWRYAPDPSPDFKPQTASTSDQSVALSKELKKRGWRFVGPTTVYAFMQAAGLVNDHAFDCSIRAKTDEARKKFNLPQTLQRPPVA